LSQWSWRKKWGLLKEEKEREPHRLARKGRREKLCDTQSSHSPKKKKRNIGGERGGFSSFWRKKKGKKDSNTFYIGECGAGEKRKGKEKLIIQNYRKEKGKGGGGDLLRGVEGGGGKEKRREKGILSTIKKTERGREE